MKPFKALVLRNIKMFFGDKGLFFTSLITPLILILLFITFLGGVYRSSFLSAIPDGITVPDTLTEGFVGGWLFSSLLAVSCVTVAFCSNMLMVQDKANAALSDFSVSPVKGSTLALGYYVSSVIVTLIISAAALASCFIYLMAVGWYLSVSDVVLIIVDVILLVLFGTALSSVINFFLSTQGQIAAVGSIVSACYGFICGAYMPISQFNEGIRTFISFLPGTYGTGLIRSHMLRGSFEALEQSGMPAQGIEGLKEAFDGTLYFFDRAVSEGAMYAVMGITVAALVALYILLNVMKRRGKAAKQPVAIKIK